MPHVLSYVALFALVAGVFSSGTPVPGVTRCRAELYCTGSLSVTANAAAGTYYKRSSVTELSAEFAFVSIDASAVIKTGDIDETQTVTVSGPQVVLSVIVSRVENGGASCAFLNSQSQAVSAGDTVTGTASCVVLKTSTNINDTP